jgi:hypothetical protein
MNTASGLLQVKDFISSTLSAGDMAMQQYSYNLQIGQERVKAMAEQMKSQNQFSSEMTEASKSPYLLNTSGGIMKDESGNPILKNITKPVQSVMKEDDGSTTILYKDGTFENKRIGAEIDEKTIQSYARAIEAGQL